MSIRSIDERLIIALMLEMMSAWSRVQQVGEVVTLSQRSDLRPVELKSPVHLKYCSTGSERTAEVEGELQELSDSLP